MESSIAEIKAYTDVSGDDLQRQSSLDALVSRMRLGSPSPLQLVCGLVADASGCTSLSASAASSGAFAHACGAA